MAGFSRVFRAPRTMSEFLDMQDAAAAMRAAGRATDEIDAALAAAGRSFDPDSLSISQMLRGMRSEPMDAVPTVPLNALDVPPVAGRLDDMDADTLKAVNKANNSFMGLESGRTLNLRNQNTDLNRIRRDDILSAAEQSIRGQQEAAAAEAMALQLAGAAALGGGMMAGESLTRGYNDGPTTADVPLEELPSPRVSLEPMPRPGMSRQMEVDIPDVDMLPVDDVPVTDDYIPQPVPMPEELALLEDDPMATANLVEESRPIPASTPKVERLTPEEIEALRSQVVSIRDAQTGQAMDSFYPPESEEYKAEQRMKKMYPQLRSR
jgi:hypothetical protein